MPKKMERFTVRAKRVLTLAQAEAEKRHHTLIGTEHILLGMMKEKDSIAAYALRRVGLRLEEVEAGVEELSPANESAPSEMLELSSHTKKLLELAVGEARRMGDHYVGTEHLLLGLPHQSETKAFQIFQRYELKPEDIRIAIWEILPESPAHISDIFNMVTENKRFNHSILYPLTRTMIEAKRLGCKLLDTQHLLLGMLQSRNYIIYHVFSENDVTYTRLMDYWLQTPAMPEPKTVQLSPAFQQVLQQTITEADKLNHWRIGPEHLLLSLMTLSEGEVVNLLQCLNISPQEIRKHTIQLMEKVPYNEPVTPGRFIRFINRVFGIEL